MRRKVEHTRNTDPIMATREHQAAVAALRREVDDRDMLIGDLQEEIIETTYFLSNNLAAAEENFCVLEKQYAHKLSAEREVREELEKKAKRAEREVLTRQYESRWWQQQTHAMQEIEAEQAQHVIAMQQAIDKLAAEKQQLQLELEEVNIELHDKKVELSILADEGRRATGPSNLGDNGSSRATGVAVVGGSQPGVAGQQQLHDLDLDHPNQEADLAAALQESLPAVHITRTTTTSSSSSSDDPSGPNTPDVSAGVSAPVSDDGSVSSAADSVTMSHTGTQGILAERQLAPLSSNSSSSKSGTRRKGLLGMMRRCVSWCRKSFARAVRR